MSEVLLLLFLSSFFMGFEGRSVSIFFSHREKFEVKDEQERPFIELPDELVKLLGLDKPSKEDLLESQLEQLPSNEQITQPQPKDGEVKMIEHTVPESTATPDESFLSQSDDEDYNQADVDDDEIEDLNDDDESDYDFENDNDTDDRNLKDVQNDDEIIDNDSDIERRFRSKRAAEVNEQWRQSLSGHKKTQHQPEDDIVWEEVTDQDLERAKYGKFMRTAKYVGLTLLSVTCFVFIGYCFIRDSVAFVFAFGTGCPCCIICCPCIRTFTDKYLNVKKIIRDSMNRYMPGMIIKDDGTFDTYQPTGEELAIMEELMEEILD